MLQGISHPTEKMFGYIVPDKQELKMREYELYRGYYCGICKTIGRKFGHLPRMTLNYDFVFLTMIADGLSEEAPFSAMGNCFIHPVRKRLIVQENKAVAFASDLHMILGYYKLKDDYADERSIKAWLGMMLFRRPIKKLMKKYEKTCIMIQKALADLSALEKLKCDSLDQVSEQFAILMKEVFEAMSASDGQEVSDNMNATGASAGQEVNLQSLGYHLGKWIYILDAYDDLEDNVKSGVYNPFAAAYDEDVQNQKPIHEIKAQLKDRAEFNLMYHLGEMAKAFSEIKWKRNKEILENILYLGLLRKTETVLGIVQDK